MAAQVTTFEAQTKLKGGNNGLVTTNGKASKVTITGSGFVKGKKVTVIDPAGSSTPTHLWEGQVPNTDGTQFTTEVVQKKRGSGPGTDKDDAATVSVTVDDSAPKNFDTYTGVQ
jgi:hypothetical protein